MSATETPVPPPASQPPKRKRRRWPWITLALLLLIVVLTVVFAPALAAGPGKGFIVGMADDFIAGSVKVNSLSLSWFGGQELRGVTLMDPEGKPVLTLDRAQTGLSLWSAIRGDLDLGTTSVQTLKADIVRGADGQTNLQRAIALTHPSPPDDEPTRLPPTLRGTLTLGGVEAKVSGAGIDSPVSLKLDGQCALPGAGQPITLDLTALSTQGNLSGKLTAKGTVENLTAADGTLTASKAVPKLNIQADDLPSDGLDALLGQKGRLAALLGKSVAAQVQTAGTPDALDLTVNLRAPNLTADAAAKLKGGSAITLTRPATIKLTATPELADAFLAPGEQKSAMRLAAPVPLELTADKLDLAFSDKNSAVIELRASAQKPITFTGDERIGEVVVSNLAINISSQKLGESLTITGNSDLVTDGQPGKLAMDGKLLNLFDAKARRVDATVQLDNLPVGLADRLAKQDGLLLDAIGPKLNLTATARTGEAGAISLTLNARAANLDAKVLGEWPADSSRITLVDSTANLAITPALLNRFGTPDSKSPLGPAALALNIKRFDMPLGDNRSLDAVQMDVAADLTPSDANDNVAAALGRKVALTLATQPVKGKSRPVALTVRSDKLTADLAADITQEGDTLRLALRDEAKAKLVLSNALLGLAGQQPRLAGDASVDLTVEKLTATLKPFSLATVATTAKAKMDRVELAGEGSTRGAAISDATASLAFDGGKGSASVDLKGKATAPGQEAAGPIRIDAALANLLDKEGKPQPALATLDLRTVELDSFPTAFIDSTGKQQGKLVALAGPTMDLRATGKFTALSPARGNLDAKITAPRLTADAGLKLGDMVELTRPLKVKASITREAYAALTAPKGPNGAVLATPAKETPAKLELAETVKVDATVESLRWPLGGQAFDPAKAVVDAVITATRIELLDPKTKQRFVLDDLKATAKAESLAKPMLVTLTGHVPAAGKTGDGGVIAVHATLTELYAGEKLNTDAMAIDLDAKIEHFPVALADDLSGSEGMILAALGTTLDVVAKAQLKKMTGPVDVSIHATHAAADIKGRLADDAFTLAEPITGTLEVTEELGKKLLVKINPIFESIRSGEKPILVTIPSEGFVVPVKGFDPVKAVVPEIKVEMGQMVLDNGGLLGAIVNLAQKFGVLKGRAEGGQIPVEFTPLIARLDQGHFTYTRRLDFLIDRSLHAVMWGEVDLTREENGKPISAFDMTLGFTGRTLRSLVGSDQVAADEVFRIPMRGIGGKIKYTDLFIRAAADLGRLQAQYRLIGDNPLAARLAGAAIRELLGDKNAKPPPPPSVDPLPWKVPETTPKPDPAKAAPKEPEKKKSTEQQLLEGALDLLKKQDKKEPK